MRPSGITSEEFPRKVACGVGIATCEQRVDPENRRLDAKVPPRERALVLIERREGARGVAAIERGSHAIERLELAPQRTVLR